jgi:PKD repeat protein
VADTFSDEVVHLGADGSELWRGGSFSAPWSVSVNPADGSCWVADSLNDQLVHLDVNGAELWRGGGFSFPETVSANPDDGSCWVADVFNNQVVHVGADGSEFWRGGTFNAPEAVAVDPGSGACWVADTGNNEVVYLAPDGTELWRGAGFNQPWGLAVNPTDGSCWVADSGNGQVVHLVLVPPTADFSATPTEGNAPLHVAFSDQSTGDSAEWAWDFGDGGSSSEQNPSHTYTTPGSYTVALTVTGIGGTDTETKTAYINVGTPPQPVADFSATPTAGDAPLEVTFTDESTGALISAWAWEFGDGGTSTLQNPAHQYTAAGSYTVSLTVTDIGGTDTETKTAYINVGTMPPPPVADFSAVPTGGNAPLNVAFTDESTGALISAWEWDFGDSGTSTLQSPTHQYTIAGTYTVSLLITDIGGTDTETKTGYIHVGHAGMANFSATPTEGVVALDVTFTDLSSGDVIGWAWSFGDGGISTAQNPTHQFTAPGKYTVSLVASDDYTSDTETKVDYIKVGFPDTPPDFWAFEEILDCVDAGVVTGYGDGSYHPDIPIDRALMATYIARALAGGDDNVPDGPGTATFPDVATGFWAFKYVEYAVSHNAVQGYEDLNYHPEFVVDRDQMAVFVARAVAGGEASVPDGPAAPTFTDVATDFWAYKHIEYCADQNIVSGYEGGAYHPEYEVTRGQMAVYIAKALSLLP